MSTTSQIVGKFFIEVLKLRNENSHLRTGQCYYNVLSDMFPELAREISGTKYDPFYDDDKIKDFLNYIIPKLEEVL